MSITPPPRDFAGRFGGQGAYAAEAPAPATMFTKLQDAEPDLRATLSAAIAQLRGMAAAEALPSCCVVKRLLQDLG